MKTRFYTDADYEKFLLGELTDVVQRDNMMIDVVENGTFVVNIKTGGFGVFDQKGRLCKSSLQYRGHNANFIPRYKSTTSYMDCDAMFLGNAYPHFGHFLIEHLNRAWGVGQCARKNIKYVFIDNKNIGAQKWLFEFMDMMGIARDDVIILNKSMRFNRIFVPTQSFNNSGKWWAKEFVIPFDEMRKNVASDTAYDKVYVSRAKLPDNMRTYGEEKVQEIFEKNGFHVIYPETLPLSQQVAIVGNCHTLAGCAGTALHLALFMKSGGRVIQLKRTRANKDSGPLQCRMCQMKKLDFDVIGASVEECVSEHGGTHAPQIIGVNENLKKFFEDNKFIYDASDLETDLSALDMYRAQMAVFLRISGGGGRQKLKKFLVRFVSCLVPGRIMRGRVRKWLKEHL